MTNPDVIIAADVGTVNMRLGIVHPGADLHEPVIQDLHVQETPQDKDEFLGTLVHGVLDLAQTYGTESAVIALPGKVIRRPGEPTLIGPMPHVEGLQDARNVDVLDLLSSVHPAMGDLVKLVLNNAEAGAHYLPTLLDRPCNETMLFYVSHGLGVGGDGILDGKTLRDHGYPAEIGHAPYTYILPEAQMHRGTGMSPRRTKHSDIHATLDNRVSAAKIAQRVASRSTAIGTIDEAIEHGSPIRWQQVGRELGRGLAPLVAVFGMSDIVIGGPLARAKKLYGAAIKPEIECSVAPAAEHVIDVPEVHFVPEDLLETVGLLGTYHAAKRHKVIS